jgi:hypothetical protein
MQGTTKMLDAVHLSSDIYEISMNNKLTDFREAQ